MTHPVTQNTPQQSWPGMEHHSWVALEPSIPPQGLSLQGDGTHGMEAEKNQLKKIRIIFLFVSAYFPFHFSGGSHLTCFLRSMI